MTPVEILDSVRGGASYVIAGSAGDGAARAMIAGTIVIMGRADGAVGTMEQAWHGRVARRRSDRRDLPLCLYIPADISWTAIRPPAPDTSLIDSKSGS